MNLTIPRWVVCLALLQTILAAPALWSQDANPAGAGKAVSSGGPMPSAFTGFTTKRAFPDFWNPYFEPTVPATDLSNSQRLHSLIQDGKLSLSLNDVIALSLENNLDIAVARYQLPLAQADYFRTLGGGAARGVTGSSVSTALFGGAIGGGTGSSAGGSTGGAGGFAGGGGATNVGAVGCCDPFGGFNFGWDHRNSPLNYTILTGIPTVASQNTSYSMYYGQGFLTGTSFVVAGSGYRQSTTGVGNIFNPEVPVGLVMGFNQHLLSGFGKRANAASIRIAKNDIKVADSVFRQQVITTVAQIVNMYSNLLYDKENVRVAQEAVNTAQKLLSDNKRQVEIGTLAPIEVVRAESEVATDEQTLVVAQTTYRQQQETLKTAISKHVDADLMGVEIVPTDKLPDPKENDIPSLQEALQLALKNRPEMEQSDLNIRNQEITIQSVRNRLLPTFDIFGTYAPTGLSGNQVICGNGETCFVPGGAGDALSQAFRGVYPDYSFGFNLSFTLRNRTAQADAATAQVQQRQLRVQQQQKQNTIEQDVRNAEIAVTQAKAQINAANKATDLAKQTLDAEQKKFQLGESTVFLVIQAQRDLATAEGNEVKARSTYAQALTQFQQATATILQHYSIVMDEAKEGHATRNPNIPGTREPNPATNN